MCTESDAPRAAIRAGTISYLYTSASSAGGRGGRRKNNAESVKLKIMRWVGKATAGTYNVSVFGEGLGAGHHGGGPVLQLAQFLPSLFQSYPSTGEFPHDARRRSLHALHAPRAGDVLGQAPGGLPGSCFADCAKDIKQILESEKKVSWKKLKEGTRQRPCCTHRGPPCPETELLHQTGL